MVETGVAAPFFEYKSAEATGSVDAETKIKIFIFHSFHFHYHSALLGSDKPYKSYR